MEAIFKDKMIPDVDLLAIRQLERTYILNLLLLECNHRCRILLILLMAFQLELSNINIESKDFVVYCKILRIKFLNFQIF